MAQTYQDILNSRSQVGVDINNQLVNPLPGAAPTGTVLPLTKPEPIATPSSPTVLSSEGGFNNLQTAKGDIANLENAITIQSGDTLSKLAAQKGTTVEELMKLNPDIKDPNLIYAGNKLNLPISSPAGQKMLGDVNAAISGGNLTADQQAGLTSLQDQADTVTTSTAKAKAALEAGDYTSMDSYVEQAKASQAALEKNLADYFTSIKDLRQQQLNLMSPTAREQELNKSLLALRAEADKFALDNEEKKFNEYEAQTQGFAQGRGNEIDIRAGFRNREMAAKEKNLLLELGLEQEARKLASGTLEQQLKDFESDFELRGKVDEQINKIEQDVIDRADKLTKDSKDTLSKLMDSFDGFSFEDLSPDSQKQLTDLATRAGLDINLVKDALKAQKARKVLDQSGTNFTAAQAIIDDNPNASYDELNVLLRSKTKLTDGDISALLKKSGLVANEVPLTPQNYQDIAIATVKSLGGIGSGKGVQEAKDIINAGVLEINGKKVELSARQKKAILAAIDAAYPGGKRGIIQSLLPGGK